MRLTVCVLTIDTLAAWDAFEESRSLILVSLDDADLTPIALILLSVAISGGRL